jgi:Rod binding domain-containing protein
MSDLSLTAAGRLNGTGDIERLRKAAAQFESTFIQTLFQQMEESTIDDDPIFGGDSATKQFKSLYHNGLSEQAAGGVGIANMVFKELSIRAGLPGADRPATGHTPCFRLFYSPPCVTI